jgi:hypothetical protein
MMMMMMTTKGMYDDDCKMTNGTCVGVVVGL